MKTRKYKVTTNFDNSVCSFSDLQSALFDIKNQMIETIEDGIITRKVTDFKITKI